jgi:phosphoribosylaminoimidazolecarboxamide formyltransferase/IMP cyclohydrolase
MADVRISTALISVSDKSGLVELARCLADSKVRLVSTGGTRRALEQAGIESEEVSHYTGYPEMMDGRVKTLHPKVHGGLLGRLEADGAGPDAKVMHQFDIRPIDLVVVNLYPFRQTVSKPDVTLDEAIENIDIGGPAMLRSAAKNFSRVAVVTDAGDYRQIIDELGSTGGCLSLATRFHLAVKAFVHVADYDVAIAEYLSAVDAQALQRGTE